MARVINNVKQDIKRFDKAINSALKEVALTGLVELHANAPVKTGNLRRSQGFDIDYKRKRVVWGVTPVARYGIYLEFKPKKKGGRPWFRKTLRLNAKAFSEITFRATKGV